MPGFIKNAAANAVGLILMHHLLNSRRSHSPFFIPRFGPLQEWSPANNGDLVIMWRRFIYIVATSNWRICWSGSNDFQMTGCAPNLNVENKCSFGNSDYGYTYQDCRLSHTWNIWIRTLPAFFGRCKFLLTFTRSGQSVGLGNIQWFTFTIHRVHTVQNATNELYTCNVAMHDIDFAYVFVSVIVVFWEANIRSRRICKVKKRRRRGTAQ